MESITAANVSVTNNRSVKYREDKERGEEQLGSEDRNGVTERSF